jgi:hygromycin-B 4-O-kinase
VSRGFFPSWRVYLANIREEEEPGDFYGKWHALFQTSFLEREVFDLISDHMLHLLDHCPAERYLVHGGYGFGNVIAHQGKVSGVVDWIDAKYGDFCFDIAWLDFWPAGHDFGELFRRYYADKGLSIPHYAERVLCYQCYIALDGLRFFAKTENQDAYQWTRAHILARLARSTCA